jgi:class 3 adenylate cyclase
LAIDEQLNNAKGQAIRLGNIGVLHWNLYEYKEALEYYERALQKNEEVGSKSGVAVNLNNLGELYFRLSQDTVIDRLRGSGLELSKAYNLSRAEEYARKAENISLSIGNKRQLIEIYGLLDRLNASRGDYKSAYQYQTEWARLKDSIFSVEKTSEIANLEARKENEIREKELKLKDLELRRKRNEQYVLIAGIVVIIVVMFVILRQRRKSEKLLLNILPVKIAKRLKKNEKNIADRFDEVSIIFIDIVEFTSYSKETAPEEVVSALNDIFTKFDMLLIKHGLEKIKTIGDCYMAVAGLPEPMKEHAVATAKFALEVKDVMHNYVTPDGRKLQFRIGVDSGPVVAGVIGESKFSYDLWGDAVNMASRMESSGLSNEIQVTENFVNEVKDFGIRYVERGQTEIKGKGTVTTYLLR